MPRCVVHLQKHCDFMKELVCLKHPITNPENGYRYYNDEQEREYELITIFKELGFTLEEIKNNILHADDAHILEILRQKEEELQEAQKICAEQIAYYERKSKNISDDGKCSITLQRYNTERKIMVSDGTVTRAFTCPSDGMDICAEAIQELFCVPGYVNLSLSDIPVAEEDRAVLVQVIEGTKEEILSADYDTLFDQSANISNISTVLMVMKFCQGTDCDDINRIMSKCLSLFSENCAALWGQVLTLSVETELKYT